MKQNTDILDKYELTDHNGNPIPEDLYRVFKKPNNEFGYFHYSQNVCPSTYYRNICDILRQTELIEGEITVIEQSNYDGNLEADYVVNDGLITNISDSQVMKYSSTVMFKLKD